MVEAETKTTKLYRIENPNIQAKPNGITSHEDLVGQWFSDDPEYVLQYLRKSTQTYGRNAEVVDGAQLVIARVQDEQVGRLRADTHPIASTMDIDPGNYVINRDGAIPIEVIPLDAVVDELRGHLNNIDNFSEAKKRILSHLGHAARR